MTFRKSKPVKNRAWTEQTSDYFGRTMWADRNVRTVSLARFISRAGGEAAFFVGIWGKAAFTFDADPGEIALMMGLLGVTSIIGGAVAGMLIDRSDPRRVLIISEVLFIPTTLWAIWAGSMNELTLAVAGMGLFATPVFTATAAFAPFLTSDREQLGRINATVESAGMAAFVVGPGLGALLANFDPSLNSIFVLDAVTSLVAVLMLLPVRLSIPEREQHQRTALFQIVQGFRASYQSRHLRFFILLLTALWLSFASFGALEAIFFRDVVGSGPIALGWVNTMFGIGLSLAAWLSVKLPIWWKSPAGVTALLALNGVGAVAYVGTERLEVIFPAALVWGFLLGAMIPLTRTLIHEHSPNDLIGRIQGTLQIHNEFGALLPLTFVPALAAVFGVQPVLVGGGVWLTVAGLAALPLARRLRSAQPADSS